MSQSHVMYLWRRVNGTPVRFAFHVKQEAHGLTIVEEKEAPGPEGSAAAAMEIPQEIRLKLLPFFSNRSPCWFDGCEELRTQFQAELEQHGAASCPECVRSGLTRKYMLILWKKLYPETP